MGVTSIDIEKLELILPLVGGKKVLELGAQNNYSGPDLPAPYMKDWYESHGFEYECIDLSAENGCRVIDLSEPLDIKWVNELHWFPLVTDFGTSEHVGRDGVHDVEAFYNCWKMKYHFAQVGGIIISENPKTGNWPGHGFQYYTQEFYIELAKLAKIQIIEISEIPAMGNVTDGWNIYCSCYKTHFDFITLEQFKTLPFKLS